MNDTKRVVKLWLLGLPLGLYTTFVLQTLWNWFITGAAHVPEVSFWGMYGVTLVIGMIRDRSSQDFTEEHRWEMLTTLVDACIPADQRESVKDAISGHEERMWVSSGVGIAKSAIGSSITLGLGWLVHSFVS